MTPVIRKAGRVLGKSIALRNATAADAAFILSLRTSDRARYLSRTSPELQDQVDWLEQYAARSDEAYFVIETLAGAPLGAVRMYDAQGESFCWGSWILAETTPSSAAIESALLVYAYAVQTLGFTCSHFQVQKENERVWSFHERFGAVRIHENEHEYRYAITGEAIAISMRRYAKYLGPRVLVEF